MHRPGLRIALLGAESTGKSQLALEIEKALNALCIQGFSVAVVPEVLREWCEAKGRVPTQDEQWWVAREQERRVQEAAANHDLVIGDTNSLMTAIYSEHVYSDPSLYDYALSQQSLYDMHLVTGLDIEWVADGIQRDGPHVREHVDSRIRHHLQLWGLSHQTIWGQGPTRTLNALRAIEPLLTQRFGEHIAGMKTLLPSAPERPYNWQCERCSDGSCEHRLFTRLTVAG